MSEIWYSNSEVESQKFIFKMAAKENIGKIL